MAALSTVPPISQQIGGVSLHPPPQFTRRGRLTVCFSVTILQLSLYHNISPLVLFEPFLISVFIYIHFFLTTSISLQNRQNRLKQNLNIQSDIPLGNIFCIQADDFFKVCDVASAADLPHSGDSRLDCDSGTVVQLILFQLIGKDRAGS